MSMPLEQSPSGYWLQGDQAETEVLDELRQLGISRPVEPGDGLDESMPPESLRVLVQIAMEMLAMRAGFGVGDYLTADMVNRGLLDYMRDRTNRRAAMLRGEL